MSDNHEVLIKAAVDYCAGFGFNTKDRSDPKQGSIDKYKDKLAELIRDRIRNRANYIYIEGMTVATPAGNSLLFKTYEAMKEEAISDRFPGNRTVIIDLKLGTVQWRDRIKEKGQLVKGPLETIYTIAEQAISQENGAEILDPAQKFIGKKGDPITLV